jgi:glycosyltransferase involved in cell wall biosynthesis
MASGLPVLVSDRCGCAADLVQEGVNGFTFDPYNVEQLAELMSKISLRGAGPSGPEADFNPVKGRGPHGASRPQLSAFGAASREIISEWGPERFALGLQQAVETALHMLPPRPSLIDRLLLRALLMR